MNDKETFIIESEIEEKILFEKIKEVLIASQYKIEDINENKFEILAILPTTFSTIGDSIYIELINTQKVNHIKFTSSTPIGFNPLKKHKDNITKFVTEFEESLTI